MRKISRKTIDSNELNKEHAEMMNTTTTVIVDVGYILRRMKTNSYSELVERIANFTESLFSNRPRLNAVLFGGSLSNEARFFASPFNVPYDAECDVIAMPLYGKTCVETTHNASVLVDTYALTFNRIFGGVFDKLTIPRRRAAVVTIATLFPFIDLSPNVHVFREGSETRETYVSTECADCIDSFAVQIARQQAWVQQTNACVEFYTDIEDPSMIPPISKLKNSINNHSFIAILSGRGIQIPDDAASMQIKKNRLVVDREKLVASMRSKAIHPIDTAFVSAIASEIVTYPTNLSKEQIGYLVNDDNLEPSYAKTEFVDKQTVDVLNKLVTEHRKVNVDDAVYPSNEDDFAMNLRAAKEVLRMCRWLGYDHRSMLFAEKTRIPSMGCAELVEFMGKKELQFRKLELKRHQQSIIEVRYPPAFFANVTVGVYVPKNIPKNEHSEHVIATLKWISVSYADKMLHLNAVKINWIADYAKILLSSQSQNATLCFLHTYTKLVHEATRGMGKIVNPDDTSEVKKEAEEEADKGTCLAIGPLAGMNTKLSTEDVDTYVILGYKKNKPTTTTTIIKKSKYGGGQDAVYLSSMLDTTDLKWPSRDIWMHLAPPLSDLFYTIEKPVACLPSPVNEAYNYAKLMVARKEKGISTNKALLRLKTVFERSFMGLLQWKLKEISLLSTTTTTTPFKKIFNVISRESDKWKNTKWSRSWIEAIVNYRLSDSDASPTPTIESIMYRDFTRIMLMSEVLPTVADGTMHVSAQNGKMTIVFDGNEWTHYDISCYMWVVYTKIKGQPYLDFEAIGSTADDFSKIKFNLDGNKSSIIAIHQLKNKNKKK